MRTTVRCRLRLLTMCAVLLISACGTSVAKDDAKKKPEATEVTPAPAVSRGGADATTQPATTDTTGTTAPGTTGTTAPATTGTTAPSATGTTAPSTTGTTAPGSSTLSAGARARAEAANVTAADFPSGWAGMSPPPTPRDPFFGTCAPELHIEDISVAKAESRRFFKKGTGDAVIQFSSVARVLGSENDARRAMKAFGRDSFARCLNADLRKSAGVSLRASLEQSRRGDSYGDEAIRITGAITITDSSGIVHIDADLLAVRTGDVVTVLSGAATATNADNQLFRALASKIADRQKS